MSLGQVILEEYPEDIGISRPDRQIDISRDAVDSLDIRVLRALKMHSYRLRWQT